MKQQLVFLLATITLFGVNAIPNNLDELTSQAFAYSKVSYCTENQIQMWDCGQDCDNLPGIINPIVEKDV